MQAAHVPRFTLSPLPRRAMRFRYPLKGRPPRSLRQESEGPSEPIGAARALATLNAQENAMTGLTSRAKSLPKLSAELVTS